MEQEMIGCPCCDTLPFYANGQIAINQEGKWYFVLCPKCGLCGPADLGKSGAIERWNERPREKELKIKVNELLDALNKSTDTFLHLSNSLKAAKQEIVKLMRENLI